VLLSADQTDPYVDQATLSVLARALAAAAESAQPAERRLEDGIRCGGRCECHVHGVSERGVGAVRVVRRRSVMLAEVDILRDGVALLQQWPGEGQSVWGSVRVERIRPSASAATTTQDKC
jgi:hypothetical protein